MTGAENLTLNALAGGAGTVTGLNQIGFTSNLTALNVEDTASLEKVKEATDALNSVINDPGSSAQQSAECLEYLAFIAQDGADAADALKYGNLALERLNQVQHPSPTLEG